MGVTSSQFHEVDKGCDVMRCDVTADNIMVFECPFLYIFPEMEGGRGEDFTQPTGSFSSTQLSSSSLTQTATQYKDEINIS